MAVGKSPASTALPASSAWYSGPLQLALTATGISMLAAIKYVSSPSSCSTHPSRPLLGRPIKELLLPNLPRYITSSTLGHILTLSASLCFLGALALSPLLRTPLRFMWNCFFKPFTKAGSALGGEQKDRLDAFYSGQADVYDSTRTHLLKGRETMLQLLAAHLKAQPVPARAQGMAKPKIWVDIGGGTGWNIEKM